MREKKSVREGRRTGMKMPNNVKRNSDGIEDFKDYFKNTDDEDDDTTNLETEESEMQGTLPSYNINYTGVFLESDSTETSECPLIYRKPLGNSSKYVKDVGRKSLRRKSHGAKKKSFSKKKQSAPFQYSDSDSSYEEKTYVDRSVVTSPVSFTRPSLATPGIGFSRTVAESPNLKSKGVKASSSSRSIMVEPQRNISTTSIGQRDHESRIFRSGNSFNLSTRSNKERKSSLKNSYKKSVDQASPKRLSTGHGIQKFAAEHDDGIGTDETFSSRAFRSLNSDSSRLQPKKSVSFSQNLNEDIDDGIEMPPVSDINSESESKKELSLRRSPRLKKNLRACGSRTDVINLIEAQPASVKRKLNFSTLNKELNITRGQEVTRPEMLSPSKKFSPHQSCVDMDETTIIGRSPNVNLSRRRLSASMSVPTDRVGEVFDKEMDVNLSRRRLSASMSVPTDRVGEEFDKEMDVNLSRRRLSASMSVPTDRVGEEFDKEMDSNAFKTPSVAVNINTIPSTSQSRKNHYSLHSKKSPQQDPRGLQHAYSYSAQISLEELDKMQTDKPNTSVNTKSPRLHKNTGDSRYNYRQADEKSLHLTSPKLSDSRNHEDGKYLGREARIERDNNKSNSSLRRQPIETSHSSHYQHSASFRHEELGDSGVPELPADDAFEILKGQIQPGRSSVSRYQFNHLLKSSEKACEPSDSESAMPESQSDSDGEIDNSARRTPLRETQNLKDSRKLKSVSNARDKPSNIDNLRSNLSLRKEPKESCGQYRRSASFRHEEPEEADVSENPTNNACNYESQKRQVRSSGSRYRLHHVQNSPERVQEESDFESDMSESPPVERGNSAARKPFTESRNHEDSRNFKISSKREARTDRDNFRSNASMRKEPKDSSHSKDYMHSSSLRQENAVVLETPSNNANDFKIQKNQSQQIESSESRYQFDHRQNSDERFHKESDSEIDVPESQLVRPENRVYLAIPKLTESRNYEERHLKSRLSEREDRADRDHVRSSLSMGREPNEFSYQGSHSHQYRSSSSIRVEEQGDCGVPEMQIHKDCRRSQGQQKQVRSSESRYQSNDPEGVNEESYSEKDMPESQLPSAVERDNLAGKKLLSVSRNYEDSRNRKSISSTRETQTYRDDLESSLRKEPKDSSSNSRQYRHSASFRHEEPDNAGVSETPTNITSNFKIQKNKTQQKRSSESGHRFDHRQRSEETFHKEADSEIDVPESHLRAEKSVHLTSLKLTESRNEGGRHRNSISSEREAQFDINNDDGCNSPHNKSYTSFRQEEQGDSEALINKASNYGRSKGQKQLERSSKSSYQLDHRQISPERFPKGLDSESEMSESRLDKAQERVNLTGQKLLSESRRSRGSRQHNSFSSARNEENSNDRKKAINREMPSPNLNTSKSRRELNRSRSQTVNNVQLATEMSKCCEEILEDFIDPDCMNDGELHVHNNFHGTKTVMGNNDNSYSSPRFKDNREFHNMENRQNKSRVSLTPSKRTPIVVQDRNEVTDMYYKPVKSSPVKRLRGSYNQNCSGIPQATVVNECENSLLNRSKSGRTINSPGQNNSRHSECEMAVSPLKRGREQRSDISMCDVQNRKTNTSLELNRSKSGRSPLLLETSPGNKSLRRNHKPRSPSKRVSENLNQNAAVEDDGNPEVSEGSQMLGSMKRKRNSSPRKEQGLEELEDQEIINDEDENNISPRRRLIETSTQKTDSRVHRHTSGAKESNHLPKTKKLVGRKKNLKIKGKASSPTPYLLARPQRTRIRPLAYWKGEYRTFRHTKDGDIVLAEMNLVDSPSIRIPRRVHRPIVKKQKIQDDVISDQEQLYFYDEATGKEKKLVRDYGKQDWSGGALESDPAYRVARTGFTDNFITGYLELGINGTKEEMFSPKLSLTFVVVEGIVRFTLRDRAGGEMAVTVGRKNSMTVPRKIPYSMTNCYAGKSALYYHSVEDF